MDVKTIFALPSLLRWTSSRWASALCSHLMFGFYCLFLPHYLPSVYTGDPVSLTLRKTVVLRAFLGHVPECSGKWDRDSCGLLSRGSAALGHFPFPFLLCPFIESPTVTFLAVVTPPALRPEWRPSRAGPSRPLLSCLPAWMGRGPAPCVGSPEPQAGRGPPTGPASRLPSSCARRPARKTKALLKTPWPRA